MNLSEKFFLMVCHVGCETSGVQTGVKEMQVHCYTNPAQNKVSAASRCTSRSKDRCWAKELCPPRCGWVSAEHPFWGHRVPGPQMGRCHSALGLFCTGKCCRCLSTSSAVCSTEAPIAKCKCSGSGDLSSIRWGAGNSCLRLCF